MAGAEVAGLVIGAIPLALLAFDRIRKTLTAYTNLSGNLHSVLMNIQTTEGLFKATIDQILSEVADEDMRTKMLEDVGRFEEMVQTLDEDMRRTRSENSENFISTLQILDDDLRNSLGMTYQAFQNSIHEFLHQMDEIEKKLSTINVDGPTLQTESPSDHAVTIQVKKPLCNEAMFTQPLTAVRVPP